MKSPLGKKERTNGENESKSRKRHMMSSENTMKGGTLLSTPENNLSNHEHKYENFDRMQHHCHHYLCHHGKRREREYVP